jgi:hypothetical protein
MRPSTTHKAYLQVALKAYVGYVLDIIVNMMSKLLSENFTE